MIINFGARSHGSNLFKIASPRCKSIKKERIACVLFQADQNQTVHPQLRPELNCLGHVEPQVQAQVEMLLGRAFMFAAVARGRGHLHHNGEVGGVQGRYQLEKTVAVDTTEDESNVGRVVESLVFGC